jgi:hypothetical protein
VADAVIRYPAELWILVPKRSQLFFRAHDETLSVAAMSVCNPDRSPVGRHVPMRFTHILRCPVEEIKIDNRTLRGVARYQPARREG